MKLPREHTIVVTGHRNPDADSILSCYLMRDYLRWLGYPCRIYLPEVTQREGLRTAEHLGLDWRNCREMPREDEVLFLVDHHQTALPNRVVGCFDHHPTEEGFSYPVYRNLRASSTGWLIQREMERAGMPLTPTQREWAVTSVWLDTQAMKSSKFDPSDRDWVMGETAALGLDRAWLEREGLGLMDLSAPMEELVTVGMKEYTFGGTSVCSGGLRAHPLTQEVREKAVAVSEKLRAERGIDLWLVIMSDPVAGETYEADLTNDGVTYRHYGHLASRSMEIIPRVEGELTEKEGQG